MRRAVLLVVVAALAAPAAGAATPRYSFGRESGNIVPFTVTIAATGAVRVAGPVRVSRTSLNAARLASLGTAVAQARLATLPRLTSCPGTLPDIAATWIAAGSRKVAVHGSCSARFTRAWNALAAAVGLSYG
jgi:hypothetical protein